MLLFLSKDEYVATPKNYQYDMNDQIWSFV
jgi:hypothetical protein